MEKYNDLVYACIRRFAPYEFDDIVAVAKTAVWKGFTRYDPTQSRATTWITKTIIGEVQRYFRDYCWRIKVPRRLKEAISSSRDLDRDLADVAKKYQIDPEQILEVQNIFRSHVSHEEYMESNPMVREQSSNDFMAESELEEMLSYLSDKERRAVEFFYLDGRSYREIGILLSMEPTKVKKFITAALEKIRVHYDIDLGELNGKGQSTDGDGD